MCIMTCDYIMYLNTTQYYESYTFIYYIIYIIHSGQRISIINLILPSLYDHKTKYSMRLHVSIWKTILIYFSTYNKKLTVI